MVCCTARCQKWTTFSLSGVFVVLGILTICFWDSLFHNIFVHEMSLANSRTKGYEMWKETPNSIFFNWTNPEQVHNASAKPKFVECGPYTYYEHHIRENVTFNSNNTVSFFTKKLWKFLPERSVGSLKDKITTLNPIVATVGQLVRYKHYIVRRGVNFFIEEKKEQLAITKTIAEFIFDGYEDPLLDLVHKLNISSFKVPYSKFGWFADRNGSVTYDGAFNMYNGADDIEKLGIMTTWNYQNRTQYYRDGCGNIDGTTGELWYPPRGIETIKLFSSDLCSSIELEKSSDYMLHGLEGK
ncbi:hypothetical protein NQ318_005015 [Aromia moschata]|uniref:Uncharacterized protein n=1 Tax=Aromia moschata TaxID=1265417 RepID=A0AAV8Y9J3_9CUCU|nr:hypothetical protein NQ318_005015 [Aromia moschata]